MLIDKICIIMYSNRNGIIPVSHYFFLYFPYFRYQNTYISTFLSLEQILLIYFFNKLINKLINQLKLKPKGVEYAKRTTKKEVKS